VYKRELGKNATGDYLVWPFNIFVVVTRGNKMNGREEERERGS
jgi:hypothetical protein